MRSRQTKLEKEYTTRSSTKDTEAVSRMMNVMNWESIQTHPPTVYIFSYGINHLGKPVFPQLFLNKLAAEAEHIYKKNGLNIKVVAISRPTHASYLENDMYGGTDAWVPISEGSPPAGNTEIEQKVYRRGGKKVYLHLYMRL